MLAGLKNCYIHLKEQRKICLKTQTLDQQKILLTVVGHSVKTSFRPLGIIWMGMLRSNLIGTNARTGRGLRSLILLVPLGVDLIRCGFMDQVAMSCGAMRPMPVFWVYQPRWL